MAPYGNSYNATTASTAGHYLFANGEIYYADGTAGYTSVIQGTAVASNFPDRAFNHVVKHMFEYHYGRSFKVTDKKGIKNFISEMRSKEAVSEIRGIPVRIEDKRHLKSFVASRKPITKLSLGQKAYQKRKAYKKKIGLKL